MTNHESPATQGGRDSSRPRNVGVVTVDDQEACRRVWRHVIEATPSFELLGEAASGEAAIPLVAETAPDLVLVDVRMPGIGGIETARLLRATHPALRIVLISVDDRAELPASVESCGAVAFLRKVDFGSSALKQLWAVHGTGDARAEGDPVHADHGNPLTHS